MKIAAKFTGLILLVLLVYTASTGNSEAAAKRKRPTKAPAPVQKVIEVEAEGVAPVVDGNRAQAREAARRELTRDALDRAIGSFVQSVTKIENYQTVSDKVFSQSKGLVKKIDVTREYIDDNGLMHIIAKCGVVENALDGVLGPAVIDALGNPRVMILLENATAQSSVQKIFEKAGYMIINPTQANILREIDIEAARSGNDPEKLREVARNFRADVLITGRAGATTVNQQRINGIMFYAVASSVRLEAVLSDTAQTIGSDEFSWRPRSVRECSLSQSEGAAKGLSSCSTRAANSIVNKIAYALTSGIAGGIPGRTVKVILRNIDYNTARRIRGDLSDMPGISGVYQRRFVNGNELEIDVVSERTADELAGILADSGFEITGVSAALVEGSR